MLFPQNRIFRLFHCMMSVRTVQGMSGLPVVDIDPSGVFKYVLIKATKGRNEQFFVRGYAWGEYHADIFEEFEGKNKDLRLSCLGGGRIEHSPDKKSILVYGYSVGFGKADHSITVGLLKSRYPDYTSITFSDEGY